MTDFGGTGWVQVTEDEAKLHPLYGMGGMAAFLGIWLAGTPLLPLFNSIQKDADPNAPIYWGMAFLSWGVFALLYKGNRTFIRAFMALSIFNVIMAPMIVLSEGVDLGSEEVFIPFAMNWAYEWIVAVMGIVYVLYSKRIRVTTQHRVKELDLTLVRKRPSSFKF